jgi:nucleotide-binding universal stress UspA family protein
LTVTTIIEQDSDQEKLRQAQQYLEAKGITATYIPNRVGPADVATSLLQIAQGHQIDLIIMGGYGFKPMLEVVLGSTVDAMLQRSGRPILICR